MKRKISIKITAQVKSGKAYIRIVDYIGEYEKASASTIRGLIDDFLAQGITQCEVYMNTNGGNVLEAAEIVNELLRFGKENVTIRGGSVIASAGTHFTSIFYTILKSNTQFMIHRPMLGTFGNLSQIKSDIKLLENKEAEYLAFYAAKTGKTEKEIEDMWMAGDVWMTASEAKANGFVDEVEGMAEELTEDDLALLQACGAPNIPDKIIPNKNNNKMKRETLIALYGLAADATDEQIEAAAKDSKNKADQFTTLQTSAKTVAAARAKTLVAAALTAKKITADEVASYEALAVLDYDNTAAILDKTVAIPSLSGQLKPPAQGGNGLPDLEARKGWTLEDYLDKDPEAYEKMKTEAPDMAASLENAYFKTKPKRDGSK